MTITTEQVKALRDETGISVMQVKQALEEAGGDVEKAKVLLRKKGTAIAAKKSDRTLASGAIQAYVHAGNEVSAVVLLSCETDFVAKNPEFVALARDIAMHAAATNPEFVTRADVTPEKLEAARSVFMDEAKDKPEAVREKIVEGKLDSYYAEKVLLDQPFIKDEAVTVKGLIDQAVQKFGERIEIGKYVRFSTRD